MHSYYSGFWRWSRYSYPGYLVYHRNPNSWFYERYSFYSYCYHSHSRAQLATLELLWSEITCFYASSRPGACPRSWSGAYSSTTTRSGYGHSLSHDHYNHHACPWPSYC